VFEEKHKIQSGRVEMFDTIARWWFEHVRAHDSNFARDTSVLTAKQQRKLRTPDISKPSAHDLWNSIQDNFMEPDKVVVQSAPDEDEEDHEPEDLAEGKLADKIPGKDGGTLVRDFSLAGRIPDSKFS
jgi:hypothetical protein